MTQWKNRCLLIGGLLVRNHWVLIWFSSKYQFQQCSSSSRKKSELTVWSGSYSLHQSFRAQTAVLLPPTSSPCSHRTFHYSHRIPSTPQLYTADTLIIFSSSYTFNFLSTLSSHIFDYSPPYSSCTLINSYTFAYQVSR